VIGLGLKLRSGIVIQWANCSGGGGGGHPWGTNVRERTDLRTDGVCGCIGGCLQ